MPTYYKHINGKKIGGLPEVVRVDDCYEQLLLGDSFEYFKNNTKKNDTESVHKHQGHNHHGHNHHGHNHHGHNHHGHKHHGHKHQGHNHQGHKHHGHKHHGHKHQNERLNTELYPVKIDSKLISGFRFNLNERMIGKSPYYSCYEEPCNRFEYKSNMCYPFLLNDNLLFVCNDKNEL